MNKKLIVIFFIFILFLCNTFKANEVLIYADSLTYDSEKNIIAKGNAKIITEGQLLISNLIIYNQNTNNITLPEEFTFKDEGNNYYYGSSGKFTKNFIDAEIIDVKILLNDGSRIVGKKAIKKNKIDIISKGSYSPCQSKIIIKDFICPIWQLDGETILHDNEKLFLYQKHGKIKVFNTPIFYLPYLVSPSPLRKKRKSGFLTPSISFNFLNTSVSQSASIPYYFNIDLDRELTFTPVFKYGGGVDSSQRFLFDYNQIISGGNINFEYAMDTTLENNNNEKWLKNGSLISSYSENINENFKVIFNSSLESSRNYIQSSDPSNELSYAHSLSTSLGINGYNLRKKNDNLNINFTTYQATQYTEDDKTTPKIFPYVEYDLGQTLTNFSNIGNKIEFYNVFREKNTSKHSENQQKVSNLTTTSNEYFKINSKININTAIYNQYFKTEKKLVDNRNISGDYYRLFPILGIYLETPFKLNNKKYIITPKLSLISSVGKSNSDKISNESSTNNSFDLDNQDHLSRFTGSDKMDNSKRIVGGLNFKNNNLQFKYSQYYEFTNNSNYHSEIGNKDHLSDSLVNINYSKNENIFNYDIRYNYDENIIPKQKISYYNKNKIGYLNLSFIEEKANTSSLLNTDVETINYSLTTNKINKYNKFRINGSYNAGTEKNNEYSLGYSYYDECFGINIDFKRKDYISQNIKESDTLTITFAFKNLGSYKSSNLAVSERDKKDIDWANTTNNEEFYN